MNPKYLLLLSSLVLVLSCKKNDDPPAPPPAPPAPGPTMNIDLAGFYMEVIITEPNGKVLLDTTGTNVNGRLVATLHTALTSLDVTFIDSVGAVVSAWTDRGVDPSKWTSLLSADYGPIVQNPPYTPALVVYQHAPPSATYLAAWRPADQLFVPYTSTTPPSSSTDFSVNFLGPSSAYIAFPTLGLYNLHKFTSTRDTVDLSKMDTLVIRNLQVPAGYTQTSIAIIGTLDTTNPTNALGLYYNPGTQLVYPRKGMQKFELRAGATTPGGSMISFTNYGDSLPTAMPSFNDASFNNTSRLNTNFSVSFSSPAPTTWSSNWTVPGFTFNWTVNAAP
ncbi:MAG TPA: hypothetical protein VI233_03610, partial [Puia sp.]